MTLYFNIKGQDFSKIKFKRVPLVRYITVNIKLYFMKKYIH